MKKKLWQVIEMDLDVQGDGHLWLFIHHKNKTICYHRFDRVGRERILIVFYTWVNSKRKKWNK